MNYILFQLHNLLGKSFFIREKSIREKFIPSWRYLYPCVRNNLSIKWQIWSIFPNLVQAELNTSQTKLSFSGFCLSQLSLFFSLLLGLVYSKVELQLFNNNFFFRLSCWETKTSNTCGLRQCDHIIILSRNYDRLGKENHKAGFCPILGEVVQGGWGKMMPIISLYKII